MSRLKAPTGGTEKKVLEFEEDPQKRANQTKGDTPFGITPVPKAVITEARVERDEDGNIIRVIHSQTADPNPLNDPLNDLDDPSTAAAAAAQHDPTHQHTLQGTASLQNAQGATDVVRSLLEQSAGSTGEGKKKRHQSEREREWLAKLIGRHGDDYGAMARDGKLNPMQQTAGDIKKRVQRMNAA